MSRSQFKTTAGKRARSWRKKRYRRGESHPNAKLTGVQVREIRRARGTYRALGKIYGVSAATICSIKHGDAYKDVP